MQDHAGPLLAATPAAATLAVPASVEAAVAEAARGGDGRLDVLLNNAGINVVKPTDAVTLEEWERVIRVDLTGVFLCAQAAARVMRRHGGGRIINMASIYGLVGPVLHAASPYAAAVGGMIGLTRAPAVEWGAGGRRGDRSRARRRRRLAGGVVAPGRRGDVPHTGEGSR